MTAEASNRRYALLATTLASFLTPFMGSAVNVALPRIGEEFGMNAITLGWVATSYILAAAIGLVPLGRLADIRGRKRVFTWGVVVFALGTIASALSVSTGSLIAARVVQGLGGAMMSRDSIGLSALKIAKGGWLGNRRLSEGRARSCR